MATPIKGIRRLSAPEEMKKLYSAVEIDQIQTYFDRFDKDMSGTIEFDDVKV
jgi:hypothetical protein